MGGHSACARCDRTGTENSEAYGGRSASWSFSHQPEAFRCIGGSLKANRCVAQAGPPMVGQKIKRVQVELLASRRSGSAFPRSTFERVRIRSFGPR